SDWSSDVCSSDLVFAPEGYIRVFQDVRGKYGSEGDYVMTRPLRGPLNHTAVDHSTDAYDTIDWLVKNLPESNGKVGMIGSSYEGFTALMALVDPHPALKAAVPMCPMVDGWKGDDWFHNGAFRQTNFDYLYSQTTARGEGKQIARGADDDFLVLGPWRHSGVNYDGTTLGPLKFEGNTALQFRREVMQPFLDERLVDGAPKAATPPVLVFETGTNVWRRLPRWPLSCEAGCDSTPQRLYLEPQLRLGFSPPQKRAAAFD